MLWQQNSQASVSGRFWRWQILIWSKFFAKQFILNLYRFFQTLIHCIRRLLSTFHFNTLELKLFFYTFFIRIFLNILMWINLISLQWGLILFNNRLLCLSLERIFRFNHLCLLSYWSYSIPIWNRIEKHIFGKVSICLSWIVWQPFFIWKVDIRLVVCFSDFKVVRG